MNLIRLIDEEREYLPFNVGASKSITISVEGIFPITLTEQNENMSKALKILKSSLKGIYDAFDEEYYFFEPVMFYRPMDSIFGIKVAMLEKETWDGRKELND